MIRGQKPLVSWRSPSPERDDSNQRPAAAAFLRFRVDGGRWDGQWVMLHHPDGRSGIDSGMTLTQDLPAMVMTCYD